MFESIMNFFKNLRKTENNKESKSKETAKERLHLVLMQDRANVSADFLEMMKQEIIEVIKKYIEVDEKEIDVRLTNEVKEDGTTGAPSLYANIPIVNIKNEAKKDIENKEKAEEKTEEEKVKNNKDDKKEKTYNEEIKEEPKKEEVLEDKKDNIEEESEKTEESEKNETVEEPEEDIEQVVEETDETTDETTERLEKTDIEDENKEETKKDE